MSKLTNYKFEKEIVTGLTLAAALLLSACSGSTSKALPGGSTEKAAVIQQPVATGVPEVARINKKGGTKIAVLVNDQPITTNDIKRRAAFVKLRRMKGNSRTIATNELVDEAMKMQEARRIGAVVSEKDVSAAYVRFAKGNKMPVNALTRILNQRGVTQRGFKRYIRASMSWQRAVGARLRSQGASQSQQTKGPAWLPAIGSKSSRENQYTLMQVVFTIAPKNRGSQLSRRRAEAGRFKTQMKGCTNARALAAGLRDVAVLDRGRVLESALPPRWKKEIVALPAGRVTRAKDTEKGVELLAVCQKKEVIGSGVGETGNAFEGKGFQKAASEMEKKYLAELKGRAVIKRR